MSRAYFHEPCTFLLSCQDRHGLSLISLAPKKIIIHRISQFTNKELLNTIFNIFLDKVIICTECELCYQNIVQNENKQ